MTTPTTLAFRRKTYQTRGIHEAGQLREFDAPTLIAGWPFLLENTMVALDFPECDDDAIKRTMKILGGQVEEALPDSAAHVLIVIGGDGTNHCTYDVCSEVLPTLLHAIADALEGGAVDYDSQGSD